MCVCVTCFLIGLNLNNTFPMFMANFEYDFLIVRVGFILRLFDTMGLINLGFNNSNMVIGHKLLSFEKS